MEGRRGKLLVALLLLLCFSQCRRRPLTTSQQEEAEPSQARPSAADSPDLIDEATALRIAVETLKAHDALPRDSRPTVELKGNRYIVTYPRELAPGERGSAFHVKVHIDARSGKVLRLQTGA